MRVETIDAFLVQRKQNGTIEDLDTMLSEFSKGRHWLAGNNKHGGEATDFQGR